MDVIVNLGFIIPSERRTFGGI